MLLYGTFAVGLLCFLVGEAIALRDWLRRRAEPIEPPSAINDPIAGVIEQVTQPQWMGDKSAKRRRLVVILIVLVLLIMGITIYVWVFSPTP